MRNYCADCTIKHLSKALILSNELRWYPSHIYLIIGNLSEAEDEVCQHYPALADQIRAARLQLMPMAKYCSMDGLPGTAWDEIVMVFNDVDLQALVEDVGELLHAE